MEIEPCCNKDL